MADTASQILPNGNGRREYSEEERDAALAIFEQEGLSEAVRQTGISKGTISSWAHRDGVQTVCTPEQAAERERRVSVMRSVLAEKVIIDADRLRAQMWQPTLRREAHTVSDGKDAGSHVEIVDIELPEPTFADKKAIMTSVAIAVDKTEVLMGRADPRGSAISSPLPSKYLRDQLAQRRERREAERQAS